MDNPFQLKIWRCHPQSSPIIPAEKTLHGTANSNGVKWCGPYSTVNKTGFWLFPPVDVDITWLGDNKFDYQLHQEYSDADYHLVRDLLLPMDEVNPDKWCYAGGRTKFTWGLVEPGVVQMWTGCIFQTSPGWCLQVRSPINFAPRSMYVMEGIIETDWMQYDIWTNLVFTKIGEKIELRRDGWPPLAQLIPIRRESFAEQWELSEEVINRDSPEANKVFEYWINYNQKKFGSGGKQAVTYDKSVTKDGTTYHKEKMRLLGKNMEPKQPTVVYLLNDDVKYVQMGLNSLKMLREHNPNIKVKIIFIEGRGCLAELFEEYDVEIIQRHWFQPEKQYFPLNKYWLHDLPDEEILYLDVDTFVNGDVAELFRKYEADVTACHNAWVWGQGWQKDFLFKQSKPWNSGVILFKNFSHQKICKLLPETCDELLKNDTSLSQWLLATNQWVREEMAFSMIVANSKMRTAYFKKFDAYNIQNKSDVLGFRDSIVFHSYTPQWSLTNKLRNKKKVVWTPIHPKGINKLEIPDEQRNL